MLYINMLYIYMRYSLYVLYFHIYMYKNVWVPHFKCVGHIHAYIYNIIHTYIQCTYYSHIYVLHGYV